MTPYSQETTANRDETMATSTTFDALLAELSLTRSTYETLRTSNAPLADRASMLTKLHDLRSEIAGLRTAH